MKQSMFAFRVFVFLFSMSIVGASGGYSSQPASASKQVIQRSNLPEELLNEVYPAYRFQGVSQTEAEALFGSAIAAVYYPDSGDVRLLASDQLQTAQRWLETKAARDGIEGDENSSRIGSDLRLKLKSATRMSLRGFLEPEPATAGIGIEITEAPYLVKIPTFDNKSGLTFAPNAVRRTSTASVNKDHYFIYDGFEGDTWSQWSRWDSTGGQYTWGVRSCNSHSGFYSADAGRGGSQGALLGCHRAYPTSAEMYMYFQFCESIPQDWLAFLEFRFRAAIDPPGRDNFSVRFEDSHGNRPGWKFWGTWGCRSPSWFDLVFNLREWYSLGDLGLNECNTLYLGFESDSSKNYSYGARVDDLYIYFGDTPGTNECGIIADPDGGELPLTVAFRATTEISNPEFYWRFGDGETSDEIDPAHIYWSTGEYSAKLRVKDADDANSRCYSTATISVAQGSCTYSISPSLADVPADEGTGSIYMTAPFGCAWTATRSHSWIHITDGLSGTGNGRVNYSVDTNSETSPRSGNIQLAGMTFTITQEGADPCNYEISPTSELHDADGGVGTVTVSANSECSWTASSNDLWVTITNGSSGTGDGVVSYRVSGNSNVGSRAGTMTIAGKTFRVDQSAPGGPPPSYEYNYYSVIAHNTGEFDSHWVSSLSLCNRSSSVANAFLTFHFGDGRNSKETVSIPAGGIVEWLDTVSDLFGVLGQNSGVVEISVPVPLHVAVRTYNDSELGTVGQSLLGVTSEQSMTGGESGTISPVKRTPDFRTNIGFINTGILSCSVETIFIDGDGSRIGNPVTVTLKPGEWKQKNDILGKAGIEYAPLAYAVLSVNKVGATVWAYASVIDNATGDPTGLPLIVEH